VVALDHVLLITVDRETARCETRESHLVFAVGRLLSAARLCCRCPPHGSFFIFDLGIG